MLLSPYELQRILCSFLFITALETIKEKLTLKCGRQGGGSANTGYLMNSWLPLQNCPGSGDGNFSR